LSEPLGPLIAKNRGNAARAAERRIHGLSTEGHADAAAIWRRIERAISAMLVNKAATAAD
jgi:hypothetical protein